LEEVEYRRKDQESFILGEGKSVPVVNMTQKYGHSPVINQSTDRLPMIAMPKQYPEATSHFRPVETGVGA
jgi:hypothetical protein